MDNLGSHRGKIIRQLIRSAGAKLFLLPKYSPDLNPIEQVFAKLKHLLRKAAARTVETVCVAKGRAGDAANTILTAVGYNFRRILAWLRALLREILIAILRTFTIRSALNLAC